jgi:hypothetical protein
MKTTGQFQSFNTGAIRDTSTDKMQLELISPYFEDRLGNWLTKGAQKYEARNWEKGIPISRCVASLKRHLNAFIKGKTDEDHEAAIACNIMFIIHYQEMMERNKMTKEIDDMPHYEDENYQASKGVTNVTKKHKNNVSKTVRKK